MIDGTQLLSSNPCHSVRVLTLNRPQQRNALSNSLLCELAEALALADRDDAVRVVIVTGADDQFAAGADVTEIEKLGADHPLESPRYTAWRDIRTFSKPMIAAVEGWCLGAGLELAMSCDFILAGAGARFGQPETNLGIIPGGGGTTLLPKFVGRALSTRMILTGEALDAKQAFAAGLISEMTSQGEALDAALLLATSLAKRAPLALAAAKASLKDAYLLPMDESIRAERCRFIKLLGTSDKAEGCAAFRARRSPIFVGR